MNASWRIEIDSRDPPGPISSSTRSSGRPAWVEVSHRAQDIAPSMDRSGFGERPARSE